MGIDSKETYGLLALLMRPFSNKWWNLKNIANECTPHIEKQWILTHFDDKFWTTFKSRMETMASVQVAN